MLEPQLKFSSAMSCSNNLVRFKGQNYEELKRQNKEDFKDDTFKPEDSSVGDTKHKPDTWKRPKDLCQDPKFIRDGMTLPDVKQQSLGDCWFVAAVASMTVPRYRKLLEKVVPQDQKFGAGIFHFRFWQFGQWVDVVVDDWLPTKDNRLLFAKSSDKEEFWLPLLEKAYAKLNGQYNFIVSGWMRNALVDLTGGVGEIVWLRHLHPDFNLYKMIKTEWDRGALMGAGTKDEDVKTLKGLRSRHAYSITEMNQLTVEGKNVKLMQLRNPYGRIEWKGAWSDGSKEWSKVDPELRAKLLVKKEDGAFWMNLDDFVKNFDHLHICHLGADIPKENGTSFRWEYSCFSGRWLKYPSASGNEISDALWMSPQFHVSLLEPDEGSSDCTVLVSLMQDERRKKKFLEISISVYKVTKEYLKLKDPAQRKKLFSKLKDLSKRKPEKTEEFTERFTLSRGDYLIIPKNMSLEKADFLLRIFTVKKHQASEIS